MPFSCKVVLVGNAIGRVSQYHGYRTVRKMPHQIHTVHTVNAKDYTKEQLDVWATRQVDLEKWNQSLQEHCSMVAVDNEIIVGFGDIDKDGYLDRLFVHADYQGKGIATAVCNQLEQAVKGDITTHASITAKPFFEKRGYKIVKK